MFGTMPKIVKICVEVGDPHKQHSFPDFYQKNVPTMDRKLFVELNDHVNPVDAIGRSFD